MVFSDFVQLIAIGLQARIPMHMTGFPGVGKTEFATSLEAGFGDAAPGRGRGSVGLTALRRRQSCRRGASGC
jgi:MoxR-like ATPase